MNDWIPRARDVEQPSCWSWTVPPIDGLGDEHRRTVLAHPDRPFRDAYLDPLVSMYVRDMGDAGRRFNAFHAGRCAIGAPGCGGFGEITDHCHVTGQTRGLLCPSCNLREGRATAAIFVRYRNLHPAAILAYYELYSGGARWVRGWDVKAVDSGWMDGPRPVTPWPAWDPDTPIEQTRRQRRPRAGR